MFGSKKNNLPPRPSLPTSNQISEDLLNAKTTDVAFSIMKNGNTKQN